MRKTALFTWVFAFALTGFVAPAAGDNISPVGGSYTGSFYSSDVLESFFDEDVNTNVTLRGSGSWNPTGEMITFVLGGDFNINGVEYLGDDNIASGFDQGIRNYQLEFFLDSSSQGTFNGEFANSTAWQSDSFAVYTADTVTMRLDSIYPGGQTWGSFNREIHFTGSAVPEPASGLLLVTGLAGIWFWRRRTHRRRAASA